MLDFDKALGQASAQIDATLTTMNSLNGASGADLSSKYKDFGKQVKKLEDMSNKAKAQAQKSSEDRDEYLKQWQASQANIQNEQLKAASEARRSELMPKIEAIKSSLGAARDAFAPFMQNLKDLNTYFANNLTPQGMTGASDLMGKVSTAGNDVKLNIAKGQDAIKDLASSISTKAAQKK
jgi:hypothetical protein